MSKESSGSKENVYCFEAVVRFNICTDSSEPSLVNYLIRFVDEQIKLWWDYTYMYTQIHLNVHWSSIPHTVCRWAKKALLRLHICTDWSEYSQVSIPRTYFRRAVMALLRLHICRNSSKPSLVTFFSYYLYMSKESYVEAAHMHRLIWTFTGNLFLVSILEEQWWLCWGCTYAQTHPNLRWSPISHTVCSWVEKASMRRDCKYVQSHLNLLWSPLPYTVCIWVEKALVRLHICADSTERSLLYLILVCRWAGKALMRLHINTDTSKRSLVSYTLYRLQMSRESSDETVHKRRLNWTFSCQLYFIPFVDEQRKPWWDCTYAQTHSNLWLSTITHTEKAVVRLHKGTDKSKRSVVTHTPYYIFVDEQRKHRLIKTFASHLIIIPFVDEQRKRWWNCPYAQTHLNLRYSPIPHTVSRWAEKTLLRLHICIDSSDSLLLSGDEQKKLGWDCTYAQTHFEWTLILILDKLRWLGLDCTYARLIWAFSGHLYLIPITAEQRWPGLDCTYARLIWAFSGHLYLIPITDEQRWLGLVCTYARLIWAFSGHLYLIPITAEQRWLGLDCIYARLIWAFSGHLYLIPITDEQRRLGWDCTYARLIWAFSGHLYLISINAEQRWLGLVCTYVRLLWTFACQLHLIPFVDEQRRLWWNWTYVQPHLNLRWSSITHSVCR